MTSELKDNPRLPKHTSGIPVTCLRRPFPLTHHVPSALWPLIPAGFSSPAPDTGELLHQSAHLGLLRTRQTAIYAINQYIYLFINKTLTVTHSYSPDFGVEDSLASLQLSVSPPVQMSCRESLRDLLHSIHFSRLRFLRPTLNRTQTAFL